MTTVLAITQFVLLTFGTIFLKGMVNANGNITASSYFQFLNKNWPWFFLLPVLLPSVPWFARKIVEFGLG